MRALCLAALMLGAGCSSTADPGAVPGGSGGPDAGGGSGPGVDGGTDVKCTPQPSTGQPCYTGFVGAPPATRSLSGMCAAGWGMCPDGTCCPTSSRCQTMLQPVSGSNTTCVPLDGDWCGVATQSSPQGTLCLSGKKCVADGCCPTGESCAMACPTTAGQPLQGSVAPDWKFMNRPGGTFDNWYDPDFGNPYMFLANGAAGYYGYPNSFYTQAWNYQTGVGSQATAPTSIGLDTNAPNIIVANNDTQFFVWLGTGKTPAGGLLDAVTSTWKVVSSVGAPAGKGVAYWSGKYFVVLGDSTNPGGRYDPTSDTWLPMAAPPSENAQAVKIVNGKRYQLLGSTLARYDASTDTWKEFAVNHPLTSITNHNLEQSYWANRTAKLIEFDNGDPSTGVGDYLVFDTATNLSSQISFTPDMKPPYDVLFLTDDYVVFENSIGWWLYAVHSGVWIGMTPAPSGAYSPTSLIRTFVSGDTVRRCDINYFNGGPGGCITYTLPPEPPPYCAR